MFGPIFNFRPFPFECGTPRFQRNSCQYKNTGITSTKIKEGKSEIIIRNGTIADIQSFYSEAFLHLEWDHPSPVKDSSKCLIFFTFWCSSIITFSFFYIIILKFWGLIRYNKTDNLRLKNHYMAFFLVNWLIYYLVL